MTLYIHIYKYHCEVSLFLPLPNVKVITASQTLVILDPAGGTCQWTALSWTEEKAWYTRFSISCNRLNLWSCKWLMWKMLFTLIYLTISKFPGRCHIIEVIRNWPSACFFQAWCTCQIRRPFSHFAVWSLLSVVKQVLARSSVVFLHAFVLGIFMCIHVYKSVFFWMALPSMPIERWQFMIGLWKGVGFQFKDIFPWCSMSPFCAGMSVKNPAVSMAQKMRARCGFLFSGLWWPWKMVN